MDQGAWSSDEEDGDYDPGLPELCEDDSNCSEEEDGPGSDVELDDPEPTAGTVGTWVGLSPERKCVPAVSTGLLKEADMDPTGAVCRLVVQNRAVSLAGLSEHAVQKLLGQQLCCGLPQYVDLARGHTMHCKLVEQFDGRGVVQYTDADPPASRRFLESQAKTISRGMRSSSRRWYSAPCLYSSESAFGSDGSPSARTASSACTSSAVLFCLFLLGDMTTVTAQQKYGHPLPLHKSQKDSLPALPPPGNAFVYHEFHIDHQFPGHFWIITK